MFIRSEADFLSAFEVPVAPSSNMHLLGRAKVVGLHNCHGKVLDLLLHNRSACSKKCRLVQRPHPQPLWDHVARDPSPNLNHLHWPDMHTWTTRNTRMHHKVPMTSTRCTGGAYQGHVPRDVPDLQLPAQCHSKSSTCHGKSGTCNGKRRYRPLVQVAGTHPGTSGACLWYAHWVHLVHVSGTYH